MIYSLFLGIKTICRSQSSVSSEHLDKFWTYIQTLCSPVLLAVSCPSLWPSYVSVLALVADVCSLTLYSLRISPWEMYLDFFKSMGSCFFDQCLWPAWHSAQLFQLAGKSKCIFLYPIFVKEALFRTPGGCQGILSGLSMFISYIILLNFTLFHFF